MKKNLPMLQIALDTLTLADALKSIRLVSEAIDVIEVGTILCCAEGMSSVRNLRALYPDKIVLADIKAADAGKILANMVFDAGANWMTVICCAPIATVEQALKVAKSRGGDVQVELTGTWDFVQAKEWRDAGVDQVVYHRGRDAQAAGKGWGQDDIAKVRQLAEMGFKVTVTGGIVSKDLHLFKGIPIYIFIAGRSIRDAVSPLEAALEFKSKFNEIWG